MSMQFEIDQDLCIGAGNCVHLSQGAISLDNEGYAQPVDGVGTASIEALKLAARSCPTSAILIATSVSDV
ncbi:ferredoxin [Rhodococcus opacus]|uniref:ferredoxin n=1 Tax=Rhodococcus opacus TaxID=37919 RepID=UPI003899F8AD